MLIRKNEKIYFKDDDLLFEVEEIIDKVSFFIIRTICNKEFKIDEIDNKIFFPILKSFKCF